MTAPLAAPLSWETLDERKTVLEGFVQRWQGKAGDRWYLALDAAYRELVEKAQAVSDEANVKGTFWTLFQKIQELAALLPPRREEKP